ncbi:Endonuclease [Escherichia coli]
MKSINNDFNWSRMLAFLFMALCGFLRLLSRSIMLMPAMLLVTLAIFSCSLYAAEFQGNVIRVLDGDTIEVKTLPAKIVVYEVPIRVRLINIDAPEKKQPFGRWSTNQLKTLLAGQSVTVSYTQTDRYGRIIGRVFTTNGTDASRFMVQSGAAWVYERYNADESLPALQREAQEQKRGLWADSNPVPPWEWRHKN